MVLGWRRRGVRPSPMMRDDDLFAASSAARNQGEMGNVLAGEDCVSKRSGSSSRYKLTTCG
jgi:hypothetical protein